MISYSDVENFLQGGFEFQLVLPEMYRKMAFQLLHSKNGHFGCERTVELFRERFYWPKMQNHVEKWVKSCEQCVKRKATCDRAPLQHISSSYPMELICIDFLKVERSVGGFEHILVITDHFSRYAIAVPTKNESAKVTAKVLIDNVINHYGIPAKIHSDQGKSFECTLIKEMCELLNIKKSRTSPYRPQGNGQVERFNCSLLNLLGTLDVEQKKRWKDHVASLVHAYNCTKNDSTGFSPFFLMYGRNPRLPVDLAFGLCKESTDMSYSEYVSDLKERLESAYDKAMKQEGHLKGAYKARYDAKVRGAVLSKGDRVLVRKMYFAQGRHKIDNKWEEEIYIVIGKPNSEIPVYEIRREDQKGRVRRMHRNLLLPVNHICEEWQTDVKTKSDKGQNRVKLRSDINECESECESDTESESDVEMTVNRSRRIAHVNDHVNVENAGNVNANVQDRVEQEEEMEESVSAESDEEAENDENVEGNADAQQGTTAENVAVSPEPIVDTGRPVRDRKPPAWYGDYVLNFAAQHEYFV
jgi:hypothetical protein